LTSIGETRITNLSPRKRKLYYANRSSNQKISKLIFFLRISKAKCQEQVNSEKKKLLQRFVCNLDSAGRNHLSEQISNGTKKRHTWNVQSKVFALALYKRRPKAYRFLNFFMLLCSKTTLMSCLKYLPFQTRINKELLSHLKKKLKN
jgi:hypothetical protein